MLQEKVILFRDLKKEVGERFIFFLKERDFRVGTFALNSNVNESVTNKIFRGEQNFTADSFFQMVAVFGISLHEFTDCDSLKKPVVFNKEELKPPRIIL